MGVGGSLRPGPGVVESALDVSEGGLVALRRWRLTGVAVILFLLAAVSVVALQRAVPSARRARAGAPLPRPAARGRPPPMPRPPPSGRPLPTPTLPPAAAASRRRSATP